MLKPRHLVCLAICYVALSSPAWADLPQFDICPPNERRTEQTVCVWDGDTVVLFGERIRLEAIDTPERTGYGCEQELEMAMAATYRLQDILNSHDWVIERSGQDRYQRTLGQFRIGDTTAGGMLIEEGLARPWEGQRRPWCD